MCGRLNLSLDPADLVDELGIDVARYQFTTLQDLLGSFDPSSVKRYEVGTAVGNLRNDFPELAQRVSDGRVPST